MLNTGRVSVESCAQQIAALAQRPEFAETEASRAMLQNLALEARVRAALRADEATKETAAPRARMHAQFGVTWGDPLLYDLVLNTDRDLGRELRAADPAL